MFFQLPKLIFDWLSGRLTIDGSVCSTFKCVKQRGMKAGLHGMKAGLHGMKAGLHGMKDEIPDAGRKCIVKQPSKKVKDFSCSPPNFILVVLT